MTAEDLRNAWNVNCGELPKCNTLEIKHRMKLAQGRVVAVDDLPRWVKAIKKIAKSPFCNGRVPTAAQPGGFVATFDWLLTPLTLTLVEEGQFDYHGIVEIEPPSSPSPADLTYWSGPKPDYTITPEQFLRAQIMGRLQRVRERAVKHKSLTVATKEELERKTKGAFRSDGIEDFQESWVLNGGNNSIYTDTQISAAEQEVLKMRREGLLPSVWKRP